MMFDGALESLLREIGSTASGLGLTAWAVGGAARQHLTGEILKDIDTAVEGPATGLAERLASAWGAEVTAHDAFGTVTLVRPDGLSVDIAPTRTERYPAPGALPVVAPASIEEDIARRDFTVNAIAVCLKPDRFGEVYDPTGGREDLNRKVLRILHPGSFRDDPTRLFRAARYAVRYDLALSAETDEAALAGNVMSLSSDRRRAEVEHICGEMRWAEMLVWLNRWGIWRTLSEGWEPALSTLCRMDTVLNWAGRTLAGDHATRKMRYLALCFHAPQALATALSVRPEEQDILTRARAVLESLKDPQDGPWYREMDNHPVEALLAALTAIRRDPQKLRLTRYLAEIRHRVLEITGNDLISAGARQGPELGAALRLTLDALRAGGVSDRSSQMKHALRVYREMVKSDTAGDS